MIWWQRFPSDAPKEIWCVLPSSGTAMFVLRSRWLNPQMNITNLGNPWPSRRPVPHHSSLDRQLRHHTGIPTPALCLDDFGSICGININFRMFALEKNLLQNSSPIAKVHVGVVNMKTILCIRYRFAIIAPEVVQPNQQESKLTTFSFSWTVA